MTLIKSISGIRGTIGGSAGDNLTPLDAVKFAAAYGTWIKKGKKEKVKVVIGRDARPSGGMIQQLVQNTLIGLGIDIVDLDLSTTPTVEMAVVFEKADGGIILTASHNPVQWNALKLLNGKGEFLSGDDGKEILRLVESEDYDFAEVQDLGKLIENTDSMEKHVDAILALPYIETEKIKAANFKVAVDGVNSTGGVFIPYLLKRLGVEQVEELYCEPHGRFPHNPEPLEKHLGDIMSLVKDKGCDVGIVVDPDVDRLALISEDGKMFGEEYTLVACADYLLDKKKGAVVSNLSSSRALRDLAEAKGCEYFASAVGEVNVVEKMKAQNAVLGGEGNGGVILPDLHYGRDSLVGTALILSLMATSGKKMSELRASYPEYYMAKNKIELEPGMDVDGLLETLKERYSAEEISTIDGVKIDFEKEWVHLRKSNTEPIIRVYTEAATAEKAQELGDKFVNEMMEMAK
ncbi:phosphoglucosamine mutase [Owenweeksia hongkongensis DSM 17368]|uniref:Phosphoglucosamine mutase n=1 Tax=Owenweeksia hongkongensis (strain DSM 17368 / CIP 108786 / JCM 12287 / NRRL B-23963 / UST20020801) TaxID=926562 RepID=G8R622_OWEHD|nr:phosphoglucosamine mutase [Owenweeksia hongkongensis]AEV32212.1 phosphoglucosamine mutase [Owenweeksia hongkongensis DSM 17368]